MISVVDPFDLPEWIGTEAVTWRAIEPFHGRPRVAGALTGTGDQRHDFDLVAVDAAYPAPVCPERERKAAHRAWEFGEVVLLDVDGRVAAGVPGNRFDENLACEAIRRVAKSVGAGPTSFTVAIAL